MKANLIDTHLLVPRSRSSAKVKVKYPGHVSEKMGVSGHYCSQTHLVFNGIFFILVLFQCHDIEVLVLGKNHKKTKDSEKTIDILMA